jgi:hypothetical protein
MMQQYVDRFLSFLALFQPFTKRIILIQLEATRLTIAKAQQKGNQYIIKHHSVQVISHNEITMRCIVNLTALHQAVTTYRNQHNLSSVPALISVADTQAVAASPLAALQIALCFSKEGHRLQSIVPLRIFDDSLTANTTITIPPSPDLLQLLLPRPTAVSPNWYAAIVIGFIITSLGMYKLQAHLNHQLTKLSAQATFLKKNQHALKADVKASLELAAQIDATKAIIERIKTIAQQHPSPLPILTSSSNIITPNTWLTKLTCGRHHKPKAGNKASIKLRSLPLVMQGLTTTPDECGELIKSLTEHFQTSSFTLDYIKRPSKGKAKKREPYEFCIKGRISLIDLHKLN